MLLLFATGVVSSLLILTFSIKFITDNVLFLFLGSVCISTSAARIVTSLKYKALPVNSA